MKQAAKCNRCGLEVEVLQDFKGSSCVRCGRGQIQKVELA